MPNKKHLLEDLTSKRNPLPLGGGLA